jgi:putative flippase GtrA
VYKRVEMQVQMKLWPAGNSPVLQQFIKFFGVGAVATALQYLTLVVLVNFGGTRPVAASAVGYGLGACVGYLLNYHFTFASRRTHSTTLARFATVAAIGLMLNSAILAFSNEVLEFHYLVAQVIATTMVLGWNFITNRLWTFGPS